MSGVAAADEPMWGAPTPAESMPLSDSIAPPTPPTLTPPTPESDCQLVSHPNGRVAGVLCGPARQPLRSGRYRFGQHTGLFTTYHEHGGVFEILNLRDGLLEGIVEVYDATGHLLDRAVFASGVRQELGIEARASAMTSGTAAEPIDPVETANALPAVTSSRPTANPPPRSDDDFGIGIGLSAVGAVSRNAYGTFLQLGPELDALIRLGPWVGLELRAAFQHTVAGPTDYRRIDVPLLVDLRIDLRRGAMRPYLLLGLGPDYAWRKIPGDIAAQPAESAWLLDTQAGFGVSGRGAKGLGWLAELRLGGRFRTDDDVRLQLSDESGAPVELLGNQFTAQLGLGVQWLP